MKYKKRGRRVKKKSVWKRLCIKFKKWFKRLSKPNKVLFVSIVILLLLITTISCLALGFIKSKYNKVNIEEFEPEEIVVNEEIAETVGTGFTNFVLFGSDSRDNEVSKNLNTDTIIIVSLNNATKEIKMVSVYRDTLLDVKNGNIQKCNSAYARGGAAQAINMLNKNLDLNIQQYVTVSFNAVMDVVDMIGGIEVELSKKEAEVLNQYVFGTAHEVGCDPVLVSGAGKQTLNGVQALTYARIRKGVGDDFARAERQRIVIEKVAEKVFKSDLTTINSIIDAVLPKVSTNFALSEILSYAKDVTKYSIGENAGFPFENRTATIVGRGSTVYAQTLASNVSQLHEFLFGTVDYQPSSTVKSISNEVAYLVSSSKSSGSSSSSSESDDVITTPSTNTDTENKTETTTPDTGDGGTTTTPNTGNGGTTTPSTGNGGTTTPPSTGEDTGTPPPPSTGGDTGTTTPPSTGGDSGTTTPPASGDGGGTTPPPSTGGTESSGGGDAGSADSGAGASTEGE